MSIQSPSIWGLEELFEYVKNGGVQTGLPDGRWVPARPMKTIDTIHMRLKLAWMVFAGRADVLTWPGQ